MCLRRVNSEASSVIPIIWNYGPPTFTSCVLSARVSTMTSSLGRRQGWMTSRFVPVNAAPFSVTTTKLIESDVGTFCGPSRHVERPTGTPTTSTFLPMKRRVNGVTSREIGKTMRSKIQSSRRESEETPPTRPPTK